MSTRYVWDRYSTKEDLKINSSRTRELIKNQSNPSDKYYCSVYWSNSVIKNSKGVPELSTKNDAECNPREDTEVPTGYKYAVGHLSGEIRTGIFVDSATTADTLWEDGKEWRHYYIVGRRVIGFETVIDSIIGKISSGSTNAYPSDGLSGSYWYKNLGSDNIDPISVSYPAEPKGGSTITISIAASTNNKYGGTVYYDYEVSLDGGATWQSAGATTATSINYTIPKGTKQFRARVKARDGWGFTSSTWVYGSVVSVKNSIAYAAVSGVIRNPDIYVGQAGVVRAADTYLAINGVIKS